MFQSILSPRFLIMTAFLTCFFENEDAVLGVLLEALWSGRHTLFCPCGFLEESPQSGESLIWLTRPNAQGVRFTHFSSYSHLPKPLFLVRFFRSDTRCADRYADGLDHAFLDEVRDRFEEVRDRLDAFFMVSVWVRDGNNSSPKKLCGPESRVPWVVEVIVDVSTAVIVAP